MRRIGIMILATGLLAAGCGDSANPVATAVEGLRCPDPVPPSPDTTQEVDYYSGIPPLLEWELMNTDVVAVVPGDRPGITLVEVVESEHRTYCYYELDLSAVDRMGVVDQRKAEWAGLTGTPGPGEVFWFGRTALTWLEPLGKVVANGEWAVLLLRAPQLEGSLGHAHLLLLDADQHLMLGDFDPDTRTRMGDQVAAFDVVRERLAVDAAEALAAYGRAGHICWNGGDPWVSEPDGARIALEVRLAVDARTFPKDPDRDDAQCDLRCSVRGEDDPCRDW